MPGEELPDPPIPEVPAYSPIFPRSSGRRVLPTPATRPDPYPSATTKAPRSRATAATAGFAPGDHVAVSAPGPHAGAVGTVVKYRPPLSTGEHPVSISLTMECPCCYHDIGDELTVAESRLVRSAPRTPTAAPKATLPSLRPGDMVIVTADDGTDHSAVIVATDPASEPYYYVRYPDGDEEWARSDSLRPAGSIATKPRLLVIAIPLTDDPAEDPRDVTELNDFIAEHHEKVQFAPASDPEEIHDADDA